ncbi:DUF983 domain-containing protein [Flavobacterium sp.]|jgi:uncharacterized protein (DUF983 family)|uniref:DUF983 domain-containing protein n=1 Tax=Flavobacterium sp. TaxID=239 RepID=UPI0037C0DA93
MIQLVRNILSFKCPRCHQGNLFFNKWYNITNGNKMVEKCSVCSQRTELEPGFYQGTGYISYGLTVGISIITFVIWILSTGYNLKNKEILFWFPLNVLLLILLQPWLMRLSRSIWLTMFYKNDDKFHQNNKNN